MAWYHCSTKQYLFLSQYQRIGAFQVWYSKEVWSMGFNGAGLSIKLWDTLGIVCNESECRSSVLGLKTTKSALLMHCKHLRTWGSCTVVTLSHVITTGLPNQLSIFSMATPISLAKMPAANVAKKVVSLRACNLLGFTLVHPIITPFVTSSLWRDCGKIYFLSINMHVIKVVFASVGIALWFMLAKANFKCTQLLPRRTGIICMPVTFTDNYYCIMINIINEWNSITITRLQ